MPDTPTSPTEAWSSISLPSGFKPYPFKECKVRPLKVSEVRQMTSANQGLSGVSYLEVVKNAVSVDVKQLTSGDLMFIMAWFRINTYKSYPFIIEWTCPNEHENQFIVELTKLKLIELPDDFKEPILLRLPDGSDLPLRLTRAGDYLIAEKYLTGMSPTGKFTPEQLDQAVQAMKIDNGQNIHLNLEKLKELENLPEGPEISLKLDAIDDEFVHGMPRFLTSTCKECGYNTDNILFSFRVPQDITPRSDVRKNIRNHIAFGKTLAHPSA